MTAPADLARIALRAAEAGAATALAAWERRESLTIRTKQDPDDLVSEADLRTQRVIFDVLAGYRPGDRLRGEEDVAASSASAAGTTGIEWWVDPIDGTTSFVYGRADWSVSVAAVDASSGEIVAAAVVEPVLGDHATASLGGGTRHSRGGRAGVGRGACTRRELSRALVDVNLGAAGQRDRAGDMVGRLTPVVRDLRRGGSAAAALAQLATGRTDAVWAPGLQPWDGVAGVLLAHESGAAVGDLEGVSGPRWPSSGDVLAAHPALWPHLRDLIAPAYSGPAAQPSTHPSPQPSTPLASAARSRV